MGVSALIKLETVISGDLGVIAAVLGIWALTRLWPIILLIATAFIFHAALLPYVEWLVSRRIPRTLSVLVIIVAIIAAIGALSALVVPAMVEEFDDLRTDLPQDAQDLEEFLDDFGIKVELSDRARDIDWDNLISGQAAVDYGQRALTILLGVITIVVLDRVPSRRHTASLAFPVPVRARRP